MTLLRHSPMHLANPSPKGRAPLVPIHRMREPGFGEAPEIVQSYPRWWRVWRSPPHSHSAQMTVAVGCVLYPDVLREPGQAPAEAVESAPTRLGFCRTVRSGRDVDLW